MTELCEETGSLVLIEGQNIFYCFSLYDAFSDIESNLSDFDYMEPI